MILGSGKSAEEVCESYLPGLIQALRAHPYRELERPENAGIRLYREHDGPGLLIAKDHGGLGASLLDAAHVALAIGAASPSLAVATVMHNLTVSTLVAMVERNPDALERWVLEDIARGRKLIASGGAEGRPGQSVLKPSLSARDAGDCYVVNGSKKPCSLSRSMDYFTASVAVPDEAGGTELGMLFIPADTPGVSVHPFWRAPALGGAESDEVRLTDVTIPKDLIVRPDTRDPSGVDSLSAIGYAWFEILISATYLGMCHELISRLPARNSRDDIALASIAVKLESCLYLIEGLASEAVNGGISNKLLGRSVISRYMIGSVIRAVARDSVELLGGTAFVTDPDVTYLVSALDAISFHPPGWYSSTEAVLDYVQGEAFRIV